MLLHYMFFSRYKWQHYNCIRRASQECGVKTGGDVAGFHA